MLLEHNKSVYEQLINNLDTDGNTCVVMGTGVGKSYVTKELLENRGYHALIVSPRQSINRSWEKLCGKKVETVTYQKLANIYKEVDFSYYDVVVCDEVHHIGAIKWGKPIKYLIDNKIVKVIGLTEDSVRYTDGGRDVALEFFKGNVARGESVPSAIEKKILNPVTYVGAMYNSDGLKKTLRGKIQSRLYAKLNLILNKTPTVEEIIKKNMPAGNRKGIIFASTIDDVKFAIDFMKSIYPDVEIRTVHSKLPGVVVDKNMKWFKKTKSGYLCSVDMISEGVHIKGVNTLIMLRRTESVNLFNQQLGRCLNASSKEPAILFDLVNNQYSVRVTQNKIRIKTNLIKQSGKLNIVASEQLIVKDYTRDIVDVLKEIKMSLEGKWTDEEDALLKENYFKGYKALCDLIPNHSYNGIVCRATFLGIAMPKNSAFSPEEEEILKKYYNVEGPTKISKRFSGRSIPAIRTHAYKLGLFYHGHRLSKEEIEFIRKHYESDGPTYCSLKLNRDISSIYTYAKKLGFAVNDKTWTIDEDNLLRKYYLSESTSELCKRFPGRTAASIGIHARKLGLTKSVPGIPWTPEEDNILLTYYRSEGYQAFKRLPGRTLCACEARVRKLKLTDPSYITNRKA